jgi:hypothetical protein
MSTTVKLLEDVNPKKWTDQGIRIWFRSSQRRHLPRSVDHDANPTSVRFFHLLPSLSPAPQHPFDPDPLPPLTENPEDYCADDHSNCLKCADLILRATNPISDPLGGPGTYQASYKLCDQTFRLLRLAEKDIFEAMDVKGRLVHRLIVNFQEILRTSENFPFRMAKFWQDFSTYREISISFIDFSQFS